eukprot:s5092_g3.t1
MDMCEQKQWELVRANKEAMCKACKNGGQQPKRQRKPEAEGRQKHKCMGCDTNWPKKMRQHCDNASNACRRSAQRWSAVDAELSRTCSKYFPIAAAADRDQVQRCLNCASREERKVGVQTCRNKGCKRKWTEPHPEEGKRPARYCPDCRRH